MSLLLALLLPYLQASATGTDKSRMFIQLLKNKYLVLCKGEKAFAVGCATELRLCLVAGSRGCRSLAAGDNLMSFAGEGVLEGLTGHGGWVRGGCLGDSRYYVVD